jgi:uncharacterized membrane protein
MLSVLFGLLSAASWGAGDFSGGLASRRDHPMAVVLISQLVGLIFLAGLALAFAEPLPPLRSLLWGALAGLAGAAGLATFYQGLATGQMGVVAPVAAVATAIIPVLFGVWLEGLPPPRPLAGLGLAFAAVWLLSRGRGQQRLRWRELRLPLLAGAGFGFFLILVDRASQTAVYWPLVAARAASTSVLATLLLGTRCSWLRLSQWRLVVLAGLFDSGGNAFYALATQAGRLDIAATLCSLYPASTVLLARLALNERLGPTQWWGVLLALLAVALIASG